MEQLPPEIVMQPEDLVDAALAGLDQGEFLTMIHPSRTLRTWSSLSRHGSGLLPPSFAPGCLLGAYRVRCANACVTSMFDWEAPWRVPSPSAISAR